jgi:hypothetical protein
MRENLGAKSFAQALISNELKIICKVLREIFTPCSRGVGVALQKVDSDQRSVKSPALAITSIVHQGKVIFCNDRRRKALVSPGPKAGLGQPAPDERPVLSTENAVQAVRGTLPTDPARKE